LRFHWLYSSKKENTGHPVFLRFQIKAYDGLGLQQGIRKRIKHDRILSLHKINNKLNIYKFSPCITENILLIHYKDHPVNAVEGVNFCVL
jgi:hypothetical protein